MTALREAKERGIFKWTYFLNLVHGRIPYDAYKRNRRINLNDCGFCLICPSGETCNRCIIRYVCKTYYNYFVSSWENKDFNYAITCAERILKGIERVKIKKGSVRPSYNMAS